MTSSSQVADHWIIYLFSESAQKDYRKRNAATPMNVATMHDCKALKATLDDINEKV